MQTLRKNSPRKENKQITLQELFSTILEIPNKNIPKYLQTLALNLAFNKQIKIVTSTKL